MRKLAKKYIELPFSELEKLLSSPIHEHRFVALVILVYKFEKYQRLYKNNKIYFNNLTKIYEFYLENLQCINNWDLVDVSSYKIVGAYCHLTNNFDILYKLADNENMWAQRISIVSTMYLIKQKNIKITFDISEKLLNHKHDLIHKAVGWMLREAGKINQKEEEEFLEKHYINMPRTMLRYAIERFDEDKRQYYLKKK